MGDATWVTIRYEGHIGRIAGLSVTGCNTYSAKTDKTGAVIFPLGHDSRPDSDWGRYTPGNIFIRVVGEKALLPKVERAIRRRLGMSNEAVMFATQEGA